MISREAILAENWKSISEKWFGQAKFDERQQQHYPNAARGDGYAGRNASDAAGCDDAAGRRR
jgi:hypothetical protein